jgi:uncharacterized Tic20 family protein
MTTENALPAGPSQDERILAALSHIGALIPYIGILAPIVIWVMQREKSRYVYIQSIQAVAYQLAGILAWILGIGCYMASFLVSLPIIPATESSADWLFMLPFFIPFCVIGLLGLGWIGYIIYSVVAAVLTFQGRDFRYLVIGPMVERTVQK